MENVAIDAATDGAVATRREAIDVAIYAETPPKSMLMWTFVEQTVRGGCVLVRRRVGPHLFHCS
jgi:hypothetical protein